MKAGCFFDSPIGSLLLLEQEERLCGLHFNREQLPAGFVHWQTPLLREAQSQLTQYFNRERKEFCLPLLLEGTPFQKQVWEALLTVGYGETASYGEIAGRIGREKASRAVGMANHQNPVSIIVPCHRIVGKNGSLTGYGGGLDSKRFLLALEEPRKERNRGPLL